MIVELKDERWCAFEIKLGANQIDKVEKNLIEIKDKIESNDGKASEVLCVICGLSNAAYIRPGVVYVVLIAALNN